MNTDMNINTILCAKIAKLRKSAGLTQDALAEKLGVTFQAVSKWENALSCPDISLIPQIAEIFDVSIDALFGLEPKAIQKEKNDRLLDWPDDGKLRAVLFIGNRITGKKEYTNEKSTVTLEYDGDALDIISDFSVSCGNVDGDITTQNGNIDCGDISGTITVNGTSGTATIQCGNIDGDVSISGGGTVDCGNISGIITVNDTSGAATVRCGDIDGDVCISGGGTVECGDISNGIIKVHDTSGAATVRCGDVDGDITADTVIRK